MEKQREKWRNKAKREQKKKEKARKAVEYSKQGMSEREIAKKMKLSPATTHRLLKSGAE